nr:MAG TPA: DNA repair protein-like protein [Caudoviricetes sp.]
MMDAMEIYNKLSRPPENMLRKITGGKLSGKTDINPQWRYKAMSETFGLVGIGWKYEIMRLWTETGAGGEVLGFAQVAVYVKTGDTWGDPIIGVGGSKLVQLEKGQLVSNDEGFKMAITDAFSTSLKMLGVAAAIYEGRWDGMKYTDSPEPSNNKSQAGQGQQNRTQAQRQPTTPPTQQAKEAPQEFTPKGGEATPDERKQLDEMFRYKHPNGQPVFTRDDIKAFSAMRKDKTAKELIAIVYDEMVKRCENDEPPREDLY